jgi:hypothetical protein
MKSEKPWREAWARERRQRKPTLHISRTGAATEGAEVPTTGTIEAFDWPGLDVALDEGKNFVARSADGLRILNPLFR